MAASQLTVTRVLVQVLPDPSITVAQLFSTSACGEIYILPLLSILYRKTTVGAQKSTITLENACYYWFVCVAQGNIVFVNGPQCEPKTCSDHRVGDSSNGDDSAGTTASTSAVSLLGLHITEFLSIVI